MKEGCENESNTFISKQFQPNTNDENAGSNVIDRRRQNVSYVEVCEYSKKKLKDFRVMEK